MRVAVPRLYEDAGTMRYMCKQIKRDVRYPDDEARRADFILFEHGNRLAVLIFTDMLLIKANSLLLTTATGILLLLADYVIVVVVGDATRV